MVSFSSQTTDWTNVDLAHQKIRLSDDVNAWPARESGVRVYRLEDRKTHRFYRLGVREYLFVSLLDGRVTVAAACGLVAARLGQEALTQQEAESIVVWILEERLGSIKGMENSGEGSHGAEPNGAASADSSGRATGWIGRLNPFWMQIPLIRNTRRFGGFFELAAKLFSRGITTMMLVAILVAVLAYSYNFREVHQSAGDLFSRDGWFYLLVTWVSLKIVHEIGHAVSCHRMGGKAGEMGIVMVLFAPLAYVDVTSCWRMPRAVSRMLVSAAGMYVELSLASFAMFCWLYIETPEVRFWLANVVVTAGVSTVLFNANPLMRFDGYYLLSDAVEIPNLYTESSQELKRLFSQMSDGRESISGHYRGGRRLFLLAYAIAALCWRIMICVALCITASVMFSGAGLVLSAMGLMVWFGKPIKAFWVARCEEMRYDRARFWRSLVSSAVVSMVLGAVFFVPLPIGVEVSAVVRDRPQAIVRSKADGFVQAVLVNDGEYVKSGELLAVLENEELRKELADLEIDLAEVRLQKRLAVNQHHASNEWGARRDEDTILENIETVRSKVSGLELVASCDGWVSVLDPLSLPGRYLHEGEEVMRVCDPQEKEIIGLVSQPDVTLARSLAGHQVLISDVSNRHFRCKIKLVDPRATRKLPAESLSAVYGGPMNVQRADQETSEQGGGDPSAMQLVEPHFVVRGDLSTESGSELACGNRVRVSLGERYESLWRRSCQWIRKTLQQRQDESTSQ